MSAPVSVSAPACLSKGQSGVLLVIHHVALLAKHLLGCLALQKNGWTKEEKGKYVKKKVMEETDGPIVLVLEKARDKHGNKKNNKHRNNIIPLA